MTDERDTNEERPVQKEPRKVNPRLLLQRTGVTPTGPRPVSSAPSAAHPAERGVRTVGEFVDGPVRGVSLGNGVQVEREERGTATPATAPAAAAPTTQAPAAPRAAAPIAPSPPLPVPVDESPEGTPAEVEVAPVKPRPRRINSMFALDEIKEAQAELAKETPKKPAPFPGAIPFKRPGARPGKAVPRGMRKVESAVSIEDWTDDDSRDTEIGLGGTGRQKGARSKKAKFDKAIRISDRDYIVIKFLARYRYAWTDQLADLLDTTPDAMRQRLRTLEDRGLIRKQHVTDRQYLWMSTKEGNLLIDNPFPPVKKGQISYATIAHTVGLANIGVILEKESGSPDDVLGEREEDEEAPQRRYKLGIWGNPDGLTYGEMTITEREIRQGQLRWRGGRSTEEMKELQDLALASTSSPPPETLEGNEGLFVVYVPPTNEHIPDLVVARERAEDGSPRHIAIELELTEKQLPEWKRILRWYRDHGGMYDKIYYLTQKRSIAYGLRRADAEVGLGDRLVIRNYVPRHGRTPFWG